MELILLNEVNLVTWEPGFANDIQFLVALE